MRIGVYPGSFDPITNGHLDILRRSANLFDEIILLLAVNPNKKSIFTVEERLAIMKEATKDIPNVRVDFTSGLVVNYASEHGAKHVIRGLRAVTDFEYEFQLAAANHYANPDIEMVFLMAGSQTSFISSSAVNELYRNGADISRLVPEAVMKAYEKKNS